MGGAAARSQLGRRFLLNLTLADMIAYEMAVQRLDWRTRIVLTLQVGVAGLLLMTLPAALPAWLWWTMTVLLLVAVLAVSVVYTNLGIRRRAGAHALPQGETAVELRADGLVEAAGGQERVVPYAAVAGVLETPSHLLLKAPEGPVVLPAAAFGGMADMAEVAEWLREMVFRARRAKAAGPDDGN